MSTQTKGPIIPKDIKNVRRHLGEGGVGPVYPVNQEGWESLPRTPVPTIATNIYDRLSAESFGKLDKSWSDLLKRIYTKPTEATGARPAGAGGPYSGSYSTSLGSSDQAYSIIKEMAKKDGYRIIELSPEEMLSYFGDASLHRSKEDLGRANNYLAFEEGDAIYIDKNSKPTELDKFVAHEYTAKLLRKTQGVQHTRENENRIEASAKNLLNHIYEKMYFDEPSKSSNKVTDLNDYRSRKFGGILDMAA